MRSKAKGATVLPPLSPWRNSRAKQRLYDLLLDESSWVQLLDVEEVHASDIGFNRYPLTNFKTNFKTLKDAIEAEKDAVDFDQNAFHDEKTIGRKPLTERGYKYWDGHVAQGLLKDDVQGGATKNTTPSDLWQSRPEYMEFPLAVFRGHKYQEERKLKETVYWQKKRNDKARKKHHEDAKAIADL